MKIEGLNKLLEEIEEIRMSAEEEVYTAIANDLTPEQLEAWEEEDAPTDRERLLKIIKEN